MLALAIQASQPIVCDNQYALCNAAACQPIPGVKGKVLCRCSVWNGKNVGYSTCQQRQPQTQRDQKAIVSTFSFGGSHYQSMNCPAGKPWASCLDQPCFIDSHHQRRAFCTCNIKYNSAYLTFAGGCDVKNCSKAIWSGATQAGNTVLVNALAKSIGLANINKTMCQNTRR